MQQEHHMDGARMFHHAADSGRVFTVKVVTLEESSSESATITIMYGNVR